MAVAVDERFEFVGFHGFLALGGEHLAHIFGFCAVHALVVHSWQRVEFAAEALEFLTLGLVAYCAQFLQAKVHRVQGEGGVCVVGVRVGPCVGHGGVVHRQELHECLSCGHSPVDEFEQVVEIAYAEIVVAAEREHGNGGAGTSPQGHVVDESHSCQHCGGGRIGLHVDAAVVASFPGNEFSAGGIEHHEFELRSHRSFAHRHVDFPHRIFGAIHTACPAGIPQAKTFGGAAEGENLAWCEHRSRHAQCNLSRGGHIWLFGTLVPADAFGECRRIERLVEGLVLPAVEDIVEAGAGRRRECVRMAPFALGLAIFVANDISVAERGGGVG